MMKGKKPAKMANRARTDDGPKRVRVKVREMYRKPSGFFGCRTRWEWREK